MFDLEKEELFLSHPSLSLSLFPSILCWLFFSVFLKGGEYKERTGGLCVISSMVKHKYKHTYTKKKKGETYISTLSLFAIHEYLHVFPI